MGFGRAGKSGGAGGGDYGQLQKMLVLTQSQLENLRGETEREVKEKLEHEMKSTLKHSTGDEQKMYEEWSRYPLTKQKVPEPSDLMDCWHTQVNPRRTGCPGLKRG